MKYLSLCSGIEAATVAWHPLGWEAVAYSEIEKFPSQVLAHHYPQTPNLGDMTKFKEWNLGSDVDVLVGGTPCQSFSVAGLRKGLDDPRGNLMLTYLAIADQYRPRWLVWENVPGVLSSNEGKDFGVFLGGLGELGYGFAYRVLDAQYFGVAQRRRRVFVVGYLGDWRPAAAVLFERHSLSGHPAPSREKGQRTATSTGNSLESSQPYEVGNCLTARMFKGFNSTLSDGHTPVIQPIALCDTSPRDKNQNGKGWNDSGTAFTLDTSGLQGVAQPIGVLGSQHPNAAVDIDKSPTLTHAMGSGGGHVPILAQPIAWDEELNPFVDVAGTLLRGGQGGRHDGVAQPIGTDCYNASITGDVAATMGTHGSSSNSSGPTVMVPQPMVVHGTQDPCTSDIAFAQGRNNGGENVLIQKMAVRRLTPVECERLQGFPDGYTDIKPNNKATPDGPRYKALGNSMAVPVMAWIGQRINEVEAICKQNK